MFEGQHFTPISAYIAAAAFEGNLIVFHFIDRSRLNACTNLVTCEKLWVHEY